MSELVEHLTIYLQPGQLRTITPVLNPLSMALLHQKKWYRSTPNGVLTAHVWVVC